MTEDGHVYSIGNITTWLETKDTSPNTNKQLPHKRVMQLLPLRDVVQHFLSNCGCHGGNVRENESRQVVNQDTPVRKHSERAHLVETI